MVSHTGRVLFDTDEIEAVMFQGPLNGKRMTVRASSCARRWGRLCFRVRDEKDPTGWVWYAQARALPRGYGVPERWMTINERGRWIGDEERYAVGEYDPTEQELPWGEHGAEGAPGGAVE